VQKQNDREQNALEAVANSEPDRDRAEESEKDGGVVPDGGSGVDCSQDESECSLQRKKRFSAYVVVVQCVTTPLSSASRGCGREKCARSTST
jgi:hypothetical protein